MLSVQFIPCTKETRPTCKKYDEQIEFFKDKYIFIVYNKVVFQSESFLDESFKKYTQALIFPYDTTAPKTNRVHVNLREVTLQDNYFFTQRKTHLFPSFEVGQTTSANNQAADLQQNILFTLSMDKLSIERRVYTLFDWAQEVGGFQGFIVLIIQIVLPCC